MKNPTIVFKKPHLAVVEDREVLVPGPGQVRLQTRISLISTGTEMSIFGGEPQPGSAWAESYPFPVVPGYNNVGTVEAVGEGVDQNLIGKRFATMGTHASRVVVPAGGLYAIPEGVPDEEAVFFTLAEIVMNGVRRSRITWGDTAVIYGAGLLGQFTAQFCALAGAHVFVVDTSDFRLSCLPPGVALKINSGKEKPADVVRNHTSGRMADVVFEVTGAASLIPSEFSVLRNEGRMVMLSSPRSSTQFDFHDYCNRGSYTIIGAHNASHPRFASPDNPWTIARHTEYFFELLLAKRIQVAGLKSHAISYREAPGMYQKLLEDRSGVMGVVMEWEDLLD